MPSREPDFGIRFEVLVQKHDLYVFAGGCVLEHALGRGSEVPVIYHVHDAHLGRVPGARAAGYAFGVLIARCADHVVRWPGVEEITPFVAAHFVRPGCCVKVSRSNLFLSRRPVETLRLHVPDRHFETTVFRGAPALRSFRFAQLQLPIAVEHSGWDLADLVRSFGLGTLDVFQVSTTTHNILLGAVLLH